jgi:hypothetical protein
MAEGSILLNLKIISFKVTKKEGGNAATLTLDDNLTNTPIYLERSNDGIHFSVLATMNQQTSANNKVYSFTDVLPLEGNNYYRVRFTTITGQKNYSQVLRLLNNAKASFTVVENPIKEKLQIKANGGNSNDMYSFQLYDATGKLYKQSTQVSDNNTISIDMGGFAKGNYFVAMKQGNTILQTKQIEVK